MFTGLINQMRKRVLSTWVWSIYIGGYWKKGKGIVFQIICTVGTHKCFGSEGKMSHFQTKVLSHSVVFWLGLCRTDWAVHFTSRMETHSTGRRFAQNAPTEVPLPPLGQLHSAPYFPAAFLLVLFWPCFLPLIFFLYVPFLLRLISCKSFFILPILWSLFSDASALFFLTPSLFLFVILVYVCSEMINLLHKLVHLLLFRLSLSLFHQSFTKSNHFIHIARFYFAHLHPAWFKFSNHVSKF